MQKYLSLSTALIVVLIATELIAGSGPGGIVTNPNQSPEWIRTLNRYASTDVDAVFFNPAGTVKLEDGTHIGFSSQSFYSKNEYTDNTPELPREKYNSYIFTSMYPDFHVVYKKENIAYMFGFDIITGGGAGTHDDGLPFSDYMGILMGAILPAMSQGIPIESVSAKSEFSGYYFGTGFTVGVAYAVNDILSFAGQLRYVYTIGGSEAKVTPYLNNVALSTEKLDMTLYGNCVAYILGANIAPMEDLNIGIRYSYYTKMNLTQKIHDGKDFYGTFAAIDGTKTDETPPQDIALGVSYNLTPRWRVETSYAFYYNNGTDWAEEKEKASGAKIDNGWEAGVGLEYAAIPKKLLVSIGYLYTKKGMPDELQNDVDFKLDSTNYGIGATYYIKPKLNITLAYLYSAHEPVINNQSEIGSRQKLDTTINTLAVGFNVSF